MNLLLKTIRVIGLFVLVLAAIAGPLFVIKFKGQFPAMAAAGAEAAAHMPPTTVTAAAAEQQTWNDTLVASGSLAAVQGVTVSAEMPGKVVKIAFEPGATVNAGDLLVKLDTSTEEAQLQAAEATAALGKANLQRAKDLRENNTNSPAELDAADAQAKQAMAQAEQIRAVIAKKNIRAPFTGRLGLRLINLGQNLKEGEAITALQTLDPIYVNFSLPQQRLSQLTAGTEVRVTSDAAPGATFEGKINAISPEIDMITRNIRVQATLANGDEKLRAGMFANIQVMLPSDKKVLAIPVTAVLNAPYGDSVFVIDEQKDEKTGKIEHLLRQQFVRVSGARGDFVNITEGLKPGEQVVTSGVFKLRPKMPVVIDNKLAPKAQLDPKPENS